MARGYGRRQVVIPMMGSLIGMRLAPTGDPRHRVAWYCGLLYQHSPEPDDVAFVLHGINNSLGGPGL